MFFQKTHEKFILSEFILEIILLSSLKMGPVKFSLKKMGPGTILFVIDCSTCK